MHELILFSKFNFTCRTPPSNVKSALSKTKLRKRRLSPDPIKVELLSQLKRTNTEDNTEDEEFTFGKTIAFTLKKFDDRQKALTKIKIQQLLFDLEFQNQQSGPQPSITNGHNAFNNVPLNSSFPGPSTGDYLLQDSRYFPQYSRYTETADSNTT